MNQLQVSGIRLPPWVLPKQLGTLEGGAAVCVSRPQESPLPVWQGCPSVGGAARGDHDRLARRDRVGRRRLGWVAHREERRGRGPRRVAAELLPREEEVGIRVVRHEHEAVGRGVRVRGDRDDGHVRVRVDLRDGVGDARGGRAGCSVDGLPLVVAQGIVAHLGERVVHDRSLQGEAERHLLQALGSRGVADGVAAAGTACSAAAVVAADLALAVWRTGAVLALAVHAVLVAGAGTAASAAAVGSALLAGAVGVALFTDALAVHAVLVGAAGSTGTAASVGTALHADAVGHARGRVVDAGSPGAGLVVVAGAAASAAPIVAALLAHAVGLALAHAGITEMAGGAGAAGASAAVGAALLARAVGHAVRAEPVDTGLPWCTGTACSSAPVGTALLARAVGGALIFTVAVDAVLVRVAGATASATSVIPAHLAHAVGLAHALAVGAGVSGRAGAAASAAAVVSANLVLAVGHARAALALAVGAVLVVLARAAGSTAAVVSTLAAVAVRDADALPALARVAMGAGAAASAAAVVAAHLAETGRLTGDVRVRDTLSVLRAPVVDGVGVAHPAEVESVGPAVQGVDLAEVRVVVEVVGGQVVGRGDAHVGSGLAPVVVRVRRVAHPAVVDPDDPALQVVEDAGVLVFRRERVFRADFLAFAGVAQHGDLVREPIRFLTLPTELRPDGPALQVVEVAQVHVVGII